MPDGSPAVSVSDGYIRGMSPAERALWDAFPSGRLVDLTGEFPGGPDDPDHTPAPVVRADVVARLLLGACPARPGHVPAVRLRGARLTGVLDLSGGDVGAELRLERCILEEAPDFSNATARQLRFAECVLPGFDGGGLRCDGYLSLSRCTISKLLKLPRAQILGGFRLNNAHVSNLGDPTDWAVFTGGLVVEAGMFVRDSLIIGGMRLVGARLRGGLFMEGTTLRSTVRLAMDAQNIVVTDAMECSGRYDDRTGEVKPFRCEGSIRLRGARISGTLSFSRAVLRSGDHERLALGLGFIQADEVNLWTHERIKGWVQLSYSDIGVIHDAAECWPDQIFLNGLTYRSLRGTHPRARLSWVGRDKEFHLDPYEQLADWYRRSGNDGLAHEAQLAKLRARRSTFRPITRVPSLLLDWAVGYGYRPWRAGWWFAIVLAVGTVIFSVVPPEATKFPQDQPKYNAFGYTLDLLMPIPLFGQRDHWNPVGWTQWLSYALIASGWILVTALIAGATRVLRPD
jgi:hypothetical protein